MSISSIGPKFLIACKYSAAAIALMLWSAFTGLLGFALAAMLDGSTFKLYAAAIIGALVGLVLMIGSMQWGDPKKTTTSNDET